jgi:hypothetical protein
VVLEINPRPWGSIAAAAAVGVELWTAFADVLAGRVPAPDLAFVAGVESRIFPRYLGSPSYRNLAGLALGMRDLLGAAGDDWRAPRFAWYAARRAVRRAAGGS